MLISKIGTSDYDDIITEDQTEEALKRQLAAHGLQYLKANYEDETSRQPVLQQMANRWEHSLNNSEGISISSEVRDIYQDVLDEQRRWLLSKNRDEQDLDEEIIRKNLLTLDLEEEKFRSI